MDNLKLLSSFPEFSHIMDWYCVDQATDTIYTTMYSGKKSPLKVLKGHITKYYKSRRYCFHTKDNKSYFVTSTKLFKCGIFSKREGFTEKTAKENKLKRIIAVDTIINNAAESSVWRSKIGEVRTKGDWFKQAQQFYSSLEMNIPDTWFNKMIRVFELEEIS